MFLATFNPIGLLCVLWIFPGLLAFGCNVTCPANSGRQCRNNHYCPPKAKTSCEEGHCRCYLSVKYNDCTCQPDFSGCLIEESPSTHVGSPTTAGSPETVYGCVSSTVNCEYEVHVIANYKSSYGSYGVARDTNVHVNIYGQSSKPLILAFTSYQPVNWRLYLPSGNVVNRILLGGWHTSKVVGYSNTNIEVIPREIRIYGYGPDHTNIGGYAADALVYFTERFGPISSFSGSFRANRWTVNIERSPACNSSTKTPLTVVVRFEKERYTVNEGSGSVTLVLLTSHPSTNDIPVLYSTADGTAQAPMDYIAAIQQTIIIPAGNTRFEFTIPIRDDQLHEIFETFKVQLSLPDEPTMCIPAATVQIIDSIVARFDRPTYIFTDNVTQGTVTVELTGRSEVDIILQYSIRDNRGRVTNHRITVPAGSNRIEFNISIVNVQIHGQLLVALSSLVNVTARGVNIGVPNQATIEINGTTTTTTTTTHFDSGQSSLPPSTDIPSDPQSVRGYVGTIGGAIGGILVLTFTTVAVVYISVKICHGRSRANTRVSAHTSGNATPTGSSSSSPVSTQPRLPPATTINLSQSQSLAPQLQSSTSSIIEAPPPAYNLYKMYATYIKKEPSEAPPPYQPSSYDITMGETTTA